MVTAGIPNPSTSYTLFDRLRQDATRREAMGQFVEKYTLFIVSRIRRTAAQLQDHDVSNLTQDICLKVWTGVIEQRFALERQNFRNWFATVIKREVLQFLRKRNAKSYGKGDDGLSGVEANEVSFETETLRELERYELHRALEQVRQAVREIEWLAFQLSVFGEPGAGGLLTKLSAAEIGSYLGITAERVHAYKFKVLKRLRELLVDTF